MKEISISIVVIAAWHADPISFSQTFFSDTLVTVTKLPLDFGTQVKRTFTATDLVANDRIPQGVSFRDSGDPKILRISDSIFRNDLEKNIGNNEVNPLNKMLYVYYIFFWSFVMIIFSLGFQPPLKQWVLI